MRNPVLVPDPASGLYVLHEPWEFAINRGGVYSIPAGFSYDGASIPKGAWYTTYSPFNPVVMAAALEHDWLCVNRPKGISSKDAAEHFRDRLVYVGLVRRTLMYRAVLWFGPRWSR